jgi:3'-phosphoadenosine 5'-phosphosulfate sulfotransferase (PAPS reductase)/FAD synthetase
MKLTPEEQSELNGLLHSWGCSDISPANEQRMNELHAKTITPNILSFSGGLTSGYMLHREIQRVGLDEYNRTFTNVFENTGREHNATLDFVHEVETRWGVPIVWLEYTRVPAREIDPSMVTEGRMRNGLIKKQEIGEFAHWFKRVDHASASRIGQPGPFDEFLNFAGVLPNVQTRSCSVQLKIRTRDRFLRSIGVMGFNAYIGIRKDEEDRKVEILANIDRFESPRFPLCDENITKADVDAFWKAQPFTLNIPNHQGNCDGCFLKARWKLVAWAKAFPDQAKWWRDKEDVFFRKADGDGRYFSKSKSYQGIINDAEHPEFDFVKDDDIPCSCAVGGYRAKEDEE